MAIGHHEFEWPERLVFHSLRFIIHPVYMISSCSSPDIAQSYDIWNLADTLPVTRLEVLISVVLSRLSLVMIVSALAAIDQVSRELMNPHLAPCSSRTYFSKIYRAARY